MTTPATTSTTSANAALAQQRAAEEAARRAEEARDAQRAAREQAQRTQAREPQPGSPAVSGAARAKNPFALPQSSLFESLKAPPVQLQPDFKPNAATRLNGATAAHDEAAEAYASAEQLAESAVQTVDGDGALRTPLPAGERAEAVAQGRTANGGGHFPMATTSSEGAGRNRQARGRRGLLYAVTDQRRRDDAAVAS